MDIPGVYVNRIGDVYPSVNVIGANGPILWVIDGAPLSQTSPWASSFSQNGFNSPLTGGQSNSLVEIMNLIPASDIERIDLLTGANAAVYGARASGGVFLIHTRYGSNSDRANRKKAQIIFKGYEPVIDFVDYRGNGMKGYRAISRTVYWNPSIKTDEEGKATIRLDILEKDRPYLVQVSTIDNDGRVGFDNSSVKWLR